MKPTFQEYYFLDEDENQGSIIKEKGRLRTWVLLILAIIGLSYLVWNQNALQLFSEKSSYQKEKLKINSAQLSEGLKAAAAAISTVETMSEQKTYKYLKQEEFWSRNWPYPADASQRTPLETEAVPSSFTEVSPAACATDCLPEGTMAAWPIRPFDKPHSIISGLNDARPGSFHHGVDIMAHDFQKVYALQPGEAHIIEASGDDARVQVGNYIYWHIIPRVSEGEWVDPLKTVVGVVQKDFGHVHLSEVDSANQYLNPLREGQIILPGWDDTKAPVIGNLKAEPGHLSVSIYDPQSFLRKKPYITPPIGPAAIAYRITEIDIPKKDPAEIDAEEFGELNFSLIGADNYPDTPLSSVFVYPGETPFSKTLCYSKKKHCPYSWDYWLSQGTYLEAGNYLITVYAWDWKNNISARDFYITSDGEKYSLN